MHPARQGQKDRPTVDDMTIGTASPAAPSAAPSDSSPATTPVPATAAPTDGSVTPAQSTEGPGAIPFDRHKTILDGVYGERDSAQKALREYQEKYGWVDQFQQDPVPAIEKWLDELSENPEISPRLMAKAARMLQSKRGKAIVAPVEAEEPQPDVPVMDAQGNVVNQTYSAKQLKAWQEWSWAQREAALTERISPLEAAYQKTVEDERKAVIQQQTDASAKQTLGSLRKSDDFTKHEPQFKAYFAQHEEYGDNIHAAWWDFYHTTILPTRDAGTSAKVLNHLQTQASGASVHPSGTAPNARPDFSKAKDPWKAAMEYFDAHPEEAAASLTKR